MKFSKIYLRTMLAVAAMMAAPGAYPQSGERTISFAPDGAEMFAWGTGKPETYDVAIHLADASLAGCRITGLELPLATGESVTGVMGWLSSSLTLENKKNVADIATVETTLTSDNRVKVTFPEPYTLTEDGVYVGVSFTVEEVTSTTSARKPLYVVNGNAVGSFYLHSTRSNIKWKEKSSVTDVILPLVVRLTGEFASFSVEADTPANAFVYALRGTEMSVPLKLTNWGTQPVNTISYEYTVDGRTESGVRTLDRTIEPKYGLEVTTSVNIPAPATAGIYPYEVKVTEINGNPNGCVANTAKGNAEIYNFIPVTRPLMEEYTGLWCGWCPRGYVALELMKERHPDRFVAVSFHSGNGDPMETCAVLPSDVPGFPMAVMNREETCDPFKGSQDNDRVMGIEDDWKRLCNRFSPADIDAYVSLDDNGDIVCSAKTRFVKDVDGNDYRVSFIAVADGITQIGDKLPIQKSYYKGYSFEEEIWKPFTESSAVMGLTFNDVVAAYDQDQYWGGDNHLPAEVKADAEYEVSYTYPMWRLRNIYDEPMVTSPEMVHCVAILFDSNGKVINCAKSLSIGQAGISSPDADTAVRSTRWFNLQGCELSEPSGICIKVETMSDGTVRSSKTIAR